MDFRKENKKNVENDPSSMWVFARSLVLAVMLGQERYFINDLAGHLNQKRRRHLRP